MAVPLEAAHVEGAAGNPDGIYSMGDAVRETAITRRRIVS